MLFVGRVMEGCRLASAATPAVCLALALAGAGCGPGLLGPADGGASWREVRAEHFTIRTNVGEPRAGTMATDLESLRLGLLAAAWSAAREPRERFNLTILRHDSEFHDFAPAHVGGFYLREPP